jgi:octaprenyl-diphosphate synthase
MIPLNNLFKDYERHVEKINSALTVNLSPCIPLVKKIGDYILQGEGKRLRPMFFVLSCGLCNYTKADIYHLATIFEYIHVASLLHDDVLDNSELRRKKPSANTTWGNHFAILGGDFLCARAYQIAITANNLAFVNNIAQTLSRLVEGQFQELIHSNNLDISKEEYLNIITDKTALLMSCACTCGAIVSGVEEKHIALLGQFGLNMGIAFQLIDDLLDYTSSEEAFGKPVGKDIREGKITLPLIYALAEQDSYEKNRLRDLLENNKADEDDYQHLVAAVRNSAAIDKVRKDALNFAEKAGRCLDPFADSPDKQALLALNRYVIQRTN